MNSGQCTMKSWIRTSGVVSTDNFSLIHFLKCPLPAPREFAPACDQLLGHPVHLIRRRACGHGHLPGVQTHVPPLDAVGDQGTQCGQILRQPHGRSHFRSVPAPQRRPESSTPPGPWGEIGWPHPQCPPRAAVRGDREELGTPGIGDSPESPSSRSPIPDPQSPITIPNRSTPGTVHPGLRRRDRPLPPRASRCPWQSAGDRCR